MSAKNKFIKEYLDKLKDYDYVGVEIELPLINCLHPHKVEKNVINELVFFYRP